ncbi:unnamed protein product [Lota lota]
MLDTGVCTSDFVTHSVMTQQDLDTNSLVGPLEEDKFPQYNSQFLEAALNTTMEAYPLLNKSKLKTELSLINRNDEFGYCSGAVTLYHIFMENNLTPSQRLWLY